MKAGGIKPAIIGTLYLTFGTAIVAVPIGVGASIYLAEYAGDTLMTRAISKHIRTPSITTETMPLKLTVESNRDGSILSATMLLCPEPPISLASTKRAGAI